VRDHSQSGRCGGRGQGRRIDVNRGWTWWAEKERRKKRKIKNHNLTCGFYILEKIISIFSNNLKNISDHQYYFIDDEILVSCWRASRATFTIKTNS
jgi:hypothetical protein